MWAEGLISAAHQVAEATKLLVHCANEVAKGTMDNHHLISAARQVGAATMQLVHATKAKSDQFSETTGKLDRAAKAVQEATESLVRAAMKKVSPFPHSFIHSLSLHFVIDY
jgi:vacuolar-type H+-ATPase subunit D/Vma8